MRKSDTDNNARQTDDSQGQRQIGRDKDQPGERERETRERQERERQKPSDPGHDNNNFTLHEVQTDLSAYAL